MDEYTEFGHQWIIGQNDTVSEQTVVAKACDGAVELTEQDLRDMLAELMDKKG